MSKGGLLLRRTTVRFQHPAGHLIQKLRELAPVLGLLVMGMG